MSATPRPWQLQLFAKTLKKQQKLALLLRQLGPAEGQRCLLVTNGDNNGALNWHFREHGGDWSWVENEASHIAEMEQLLGQPVLHGSPERIPVEDAGFDVVISIDVHEHLENCRPFSRELQRVVRPGGRAIVTTPNGDLFKPVTALKRLIGMTKEKYGHFVYGYNVRQHETMLREAGMEPIASGSYSRFFTEMIELALNFGYVMLLSRKKKPDFEQGTIAPSSGQQLESVAKQLKIYSAIYPVLRTVSALDAIFFFFTGYAVSVVGRRPK